MNCLIAQNLKKSTCNIIKRGYIDPAVAGHLLFAGSVACINMINIPNPKINGATARLVAFSALKGALYGVAPGFAIFGMLITYDRFDHHLIPASVWCKHLRQCVPKSEENKKIQ